MKNFGILLLAMVSCCLLQAKDRVVKQPPFIARSSSTIEIDRVVVSDTATVLDVKAFFRPHNWIQIVMKVICWLIMERSIRFVPVMELPWAKNFGCPIAVRLLLVLFFRYCPLQ